MMNMTNKELVMMELNDEELNNVSGGEIKVNWEDVKDKALDELMYSIPGVGLFWTYWRKRSKKSQGQSVA